jgi:hypothetical protein
MLTGLLEICNLFAAHHLKFWAMGLTSTKTVGKHSGKCKYLR